MEGSATGDVSREVCRGLGEGYRNGVIMFREDDPAPLICRPALYGLYHFAWQNTYKYDALRLYIRALTAYLEHSTTKCTGLLFHYPWSTHVCISPNLHVCVHVWWMYCTVFGVSVNFCR